MIDDLTEDYSAAPKYSTVDLLLGNPHSLILAPEQTIIGPTEDCNVIAGEWAISSVTESVLRAVITMPPIRVFMWPISELVARSPVTAFVTFVTCCHGAALRCPDLSHWSHPGTRQTQPTSFGTFWVGDWSLAMNF